MSLVWSGKSVGVPYVVAFARTHRLENDDAGLKGFYSEMADGQIKLLLVH